MAKRIAFLGNAPHFIPTYKAVLKKLSEHFNIVVYSEFPVDSNEIQREQHYSIRAVPPGRYPKRIRELLFFMMVLKDHWKQPFDLVHAHSTYPTGLAAILLQKIFKVPALVSLDAGEGSALPDVAFGDLLHRTRTKINRWVITRAAAVTTLTRFQRDEVYRNLQISREIIVIPRGVDLTQFSAERRISLNKPVIFLNIGYLTPLKDPETLIKSFYYIQQKVESVLIHVGNDYMNGHVQKLVDELGLKNKVFFKGFVEYPKLIEHYRQSDVLLHTSRYESQAMVVTEAMAAGLLIVGTRVGILNDLTGECCVTVLPQQPEQLASQVTDLLRNESEMDRLRNNAYQWSKANDLEMTVRSIVSLYQSLLK